mgnify:CR=1 FL=1
MLIFNISYFIHSLDLAHRHKRKYEEFNQMQSDSILAFRNDLKISQQTLAHSLDQIMTSQRTFQEDLQQSIFFVQENGSFSFLFFFFFSFFFFFLVQISFQLPLTPRMSKELLLR